MLTAAVKSATMHTQPTPVMNALYIIGVHAMTDASYRRFVRWHHMSGRGQIQVASKRTTTIKVRGTKTFRALRMYDDMWIVYCGPNVIPQRFIDADSCLPMRMSPHSSCRNALSLLGLARNLCWVLNLKQRRIVTEMTSKDVPHLEAVFNQTFGKIVRLEH